MQDEPNEELRIELVRELEHFERLAEPLGSEQFERLLLAIRNSANLGLVDDALLSVKGGCLRRRRTSRTAAPSDTPPRSPSAFSCSPKYIVKREAMEDVRALLARYDDHGETDR